MVTKNIAKQKEPALKTFFRDVVRNRTLLLMLLPGMLLVFVFSYIPMGGVVLAFKRFNYQDGIFGSPWVGFQNFIFFFSSGTAFKVTRNTALYNIAFIIVNTTVELLFAVILCEMAGTRLKKGIQSFIFLPYFIGWVIVGSIVYTLFSYEYGIVNNLLSSLGISRVNFYSSPGYWPFIIVLINAWKGIGYGMVVYMAAITGVDPALSEAAVIDGANIYQRTIHVTLPSVLNTTVILLLLSIGGIFRGNLQLFYQLIGSNGMLFDMTDVIDTYVYRLLLQATDMGQTIAIGFYQSALCLVTILLANRLVKSWDPDYTLF